MSVQTGYTRADLAALTAIAPSDRGDGMLLFILSENAWYRFDSDATDEPDSNKVLACDIGDGRWFMAVAGISSGGGDGGSSGGGGQQITVQAENPTYNTTITTPNQLVLQFSQGHPPYYPNVIETRCVLWLGLEVGTKKWYALTGHVRFYDPYSSGYSFSDVNKDFSGQIIIQSRQHQNGDPGEQEGSNRDRFNMYYYN